METISTAVGKKGAVRPSPRRNSPPSRSSARHWPARKISINSIMRSPRPLPRWNSTACWRTPWKSSRVSTRRRSRSTQADNPAERRDVEVSEVVGRSRGDSSERWPRDSARRRLPTGSTPGSSRGFCTPRKPLTTLTLDEEASTKAQEESAAQVGPVMVAYRPGDLAGQSGRRDRRSRSSNC